MYLLRAPLVVLTKCSILTNICTCIYAYIHVYMCVYIHVHIYIYMYIIHVYYPPDDEPIMYIPFQVNICHKSILLILQYKYLKSCSEDWIVKNPTKIWFSAQDHAVLLLLLNIVGFFISARQKSAWWKWLVPQLYQHGRGILEGPALKYFYMIHRGGRIDKMRHIVQIYVFMYMHICMYTYVYIYIYIYFCMYIMLSVCRVPPSSSTVFWYFIQS